MVRKIILHIGAEKTGTTSIQEFLSVNRELLREQGICFPASCGAKNHTRLALYAANDKRGICKKAARRLGKDGLADLRSRIKADLGDELAAGCPAGSGVSVLAFSAEHMHSQLQTKPEIERLRELLPAADEVKVVFYIRRQDRAAVSLYSTALKAGGGAEEFDFPVAESGGRLPYRFDYLRAYRLWASVFGQEAVVVRIFDRKEFVNGDLVEDFCFAAGIPWSERFQKPAMKNVALDVNGEFVTKRFNKLVKAGDASFAERELRAMKLLITTSFCSSTKFRPARESALAFFGKFQAVNAKLRKLAFPERKRALFDDDFSEYPEAAVETASIIDPATIADVLLRAWLDLAGQKTAARPGPAGGRRRKAAHSVQ